MATYTKFQPFVEHLAEKVHNLASDAITVALTNTAPVATSADLTGITQIAYTSLSSRVVTISSSSQSAGTYSLVPADLVLTASGAVGPFRYVVLYNDTAIAPADALIAYYDYGSSISLASGETFTIDFGANLFTLV